MDLTGLKGQAAVRVAVALPDIGLQEGDHLTLDTEAAPTLGRYLAVEEADGVTRLYRVRAVAPLIMERHAGPATVFDDRYHRIVAVGVRLLRDL